MSLGFGSLGGLGVWVQGLGFRVQGLGFRGLGLGLVGFRGRGFRLAEVGPEKLPIIHVIKAFVG